MVNGLALDALVAARGPAEFALDPADMVSIMAASVGVH